MPTTFYPSNRSCPTASRGATRMLVDNVAREMFARGYFAPQPSCARGSNDIGEGPQFNSRKYDFKGSFTISGTTKDSAGAALGSCAVHLYQTGSDIEIGETVSDGSGLFSFTLGNNSGYFYIVAYLPGSPDVAGTTVNTLTAA